MLVRWRLIIAEVSGRSGMGAEFAGLSAVPNFRKR